MTATAVPATLIRPRTRLRYRPNSTLITGVSLITGLILVAIFAPQIAPYSPTDFDYNAVLQPPSAQHWFGTDNFGRDILSPRDLGARIDLQIALFTTLVPFFAGSIIGAGAGYYGKWLDSLFGLIVNVVVVIPFLVLVIAIVAFLGPGLRNMYIAVSLVGWVSYARLVRGEMLVQKQSDYSLAARHGLYVGARGGATLAA